MLNEEKQNYINEETQSDIKQLFSHADIANREMSVIKIDIADIKTDLSWLKRFFWIVLSASVGTLITGVLSLIFK